MHGVSFAQHAGMQTSTVLLQPVHLSTRHNVLVTSAGGAGQQTGAGAGSQQTGAGAGAGSQQVGAGSQQSFLQNSPASTVEAAKKTTAAHNATAILRVNMVIFLSIKLGPCRNMQH